MVTKKAEPKTKMQCVYVSRVRNTSPGFSVYTGTIEGTGMPLTIKQFCGPVRAGQRWTIAGGEVDDPRWGRQFVAQFATLAAPRTEREFEEFLSSDLIDGWDMWKLPALRNAAPGGAWARYTQEPWYLADVEGITPEMIRSLADALSRAAGMAPIYAQLADWGLGGRQSEALVKHYGFACVAALTTNPYANLQEINGYGWKSAESIARALEIPSDDPRRIHAGIETAVHEATWQAGSTWLAESYAISAAAVLLQLPALLVGSELDAAVADERLVRNGERIYPEGLYRAEQTIAAQVAQRSALRLMLYSAVATDPPESCSGDQWDAVLQALRSHLSLLTGGPGTGKTTTLRTLIEKARQLGMAVICMAPTGKAAARMTEATGVQATTIHSRLRIVPGVAGSADDIEPVTGLVIVDEVSMLDTSLAAAMLSRISMSAQILLVGDPDQLPSVGPGAVLRDLIDADVLPRVHLDHVYRNEAGIAVNAARMRAGKPILSLPDCTILPVDTQEEALARLVDLVALEASVAPTGALPLILTPTNDGPVGRYELNQVLQPLCNDAPERSGIVQYAGSSKDPDGTLRKKSEELRRGDRVMVIRNNSELGVFNGQVGTVVDVVVPRSLDVEIDGEVKTFAGEDKRLLTLAYAITGHKAQGSEAPLVIAPIFSSRVLSREWLYTVITRAKERCILIGDAGAIQNCIRIRRTYDRRTGLVDALRVTTGGGR